MMVYKVTDEKVRSIIERYTAANCGPNRIEFVRDGNGDYIVGGEVLLDERYTFEKRKKGETRTTLRSKLQTELTREQVVLTGELNIAQLFREYGQLIEYVPIPDSIEQTEVVMKR